MRLTRKELLLAAFALLLVGAVAWVWLSPTGLTQAPAIALTTIEGKRIELTGLRGKPVLVNFWATTCPSCVKEMPELMALHRDLATQGFTVIGIAMPYDRPDQVLRMARERAIPYPVVLDPMGEATRAFGNVVLTPTSFLIAPDGRVAQSVVGEIDVEAVRKQVQSWLKS